MRIDKHGFLLLLIFLVTSFMWSSGTFNFGTAVRHHILTNWILLILAGEAINIIKQTKIYKNNDFKYFSNS